LCLCVFVGEFQAHAVGVEVVAVVVDEDVVVGEAELAVEADGAEIVGADFEIRPGSTAIAQRIEQGGDEPATETAPLPGWVNGDGIDAAGHASAVATHQSQRPSDDHAVLLSDESDRAGAGQGVLNLAAGEGFFDPREASLLQRVDRRGVGRIGLSNDQVHGYAA
jgi:hypothetical protein